MSRGDSSECRYFTTPQGCRNGNSCPFIHNSGGVANQSYGGNNNYSGNFGHHNTDYNQNNYQHNYNPNNNYNSNYHNYDNNYDDYVDDYNSYNPNGGYQNNNWGPPQNGGGHQYAGDQQYDNWNGGDYGGGAGEYYDQGGEGGGGEYYDESQEAEWNEEYIPEEEEITQPDLQTLAQPEPVPTEVLTNPRSASRTKPQIHDLKLVYTKQNLPISAEMLINIFHFLSIKDLISASRTCKDWYNISSSSSVWAPLLFYVQKRFTSQTPNPKYVQSLTATSIYTSQFSQSLQNTLLRNFNQVQFELEKDPLISHISGGVITRQFVCQSLINADQGLLLIGGNMGIVEAYDLTRRVWSREERKMREKEQDRTFWRTDKNLYSGAVVAMKHFVDTDPDSFFTITANDCQIHEYKFPSLESRERIKPVHSTAIYKKPSASTNLLAGNQFEADFNQQIIVVSGMKGFDKKNIFITSRNSPGTLISEFETQNPFDKLLLTPSGLFTTRTSGAQRYDLNTLQLISNFNYQSFMYHPLIVDEMGNEVIVGGNKSNIKLFDVRTGKETMEFPEWVERERGEEMVGINGNVKSLMADWHTIVTGTDCVQVWDRRAWKWRGSFAMGHRSVNSDPVINGVHWLGERGGSVLVATEAHSSVSMWRFY